MPELMVGGNRGSILPLHASTWYRCTTRKGAPTTVDCGNALWSWLPRANKPKEEEESKPLLHPYIHYLYCLSFEGGGMEAIPAAIGREAVYIANRSPHQSNHLIIMFDVLQWPRFSSLPQLILSEEAERNSKPGTKGNKGVNGPKRTQSPVFFHKLYPEARFCDITGFSVDSGSDCGLTSPRSLRNRYL